MSLYYDALHCIHVMYMCVCVHTYVCKYIHSYICMYIYVSAYINAWLHSTNAVQCITATVCAVALAKC